MERQTNLRDRLRTLSKCVCDGARLMVGQGDYAAYAEHVRRTHPDRAPMTGSWPPTVTSASGARTTV